MHRKTCAVSVQSFRKCAIHLMPLYPSAGSFKKSISNMMPIVSWINGICCKWLTEIDFHGDSFKKLTTPQKSVIIMDNSMISCLHKMCEEQFVRQRRAMLWVFFHVSAIS